jgi:UDP-GlcNAc:undecaprenyl-phosphate GlcNAc-1-phosphate transferase
MPLQILPINTTLGPLLLIFVAALLISAVLVPVVQRLARRFDVLDAPSARKIHANPVPLLGGAAIYLAVMLALVLLGYLNYVQQTASILIGATLMTGLGVWDDKWGLRPIAKLIGQVGAASLLYFTGVQIQLQHKDLKK